MNHPARRHSPHGPFLAEVLRRLAQRSPESLDPWLPFPQSGCSYGFGRPPRPLPIGALRLLWAHGHPFRQPCPDCGSDLHMISMGGLLAVGGGRLICIGCDAEFFQSIGNLPIVGGIVAQALQGTEFKPTSMVYGGCVGSDGAKLLRELGLPLVGREPEDGVVRLENGVRLRFGLEVPADDGSTRHAEPDRKLGSRCQTGAVRRFADFCRRFLGLV